MNLVKTIVWKRLLNESLTLFYGFESMEYHCKPFTMSMLINAFSTGITQRIVVYSKKKKKKKQRKSLQKKRKKNKQKYYIFILTTFLHLQAIITPCWRVNKLIFCSSHLTIRSENWLLLLFMHTMLVSFVLVLIHVFMNKLWFCSSNCQML